MITSDTFSDIHLRNFSTIPTKHTINNYLKFPFTNFYYSSNPLIIFFRVKNFQSSTFPMIALVLLYIMFKYYYIYIIPMVSWILHIFTYTGILIYELFFILSHHYHLLCLVMGKTICFLRFGNIYMYV